MGLVRARADFDSQLGGAVMNVIADCVLNQGNDLYDVVNMIQDTLFRQVCWLNIEMHHEYNNGKCPNPPFIEFTQLCRRLEQEYNEAHEAIHRDKSKDDA